MMPIVIKDDSGKEVKGGSVSFQGASCFGCLFVLFLAIVGFGTAISALASLFS